MGGRGRARSRVAAPPSAIAAAVPEGPPEALQTRPDPKGKLGALIGLLRSPGGAQIAQMMAATGWQAHSVRGAMSGALKKKLGLTITSEKTDAGRTYRMAAAGAGTAA